MLKSLKLDKYGDFPPQAQACAGRANSVVAVLEACLPLLRERLDGLAEEVGRPSAINEDVIWDVANQVTSDLALKARSEVMTPLRHALTGRKASAVSDWSANLLTPSERAECTDYHGHSRCRAQPGPYTSWSSLRQGSTATTMIRSDLHRADICMTAHHDSSSTLPSGFDGSRSAWPTSTSRPPVDAYRYTLGPPFRFAFFGLGFVVPFLLLS